MTDSPSDADRRIDELEAALDDMAARHSALEWIVEQHFARYLLDMPPTEAEGFLMGISQRPAPAFMQSSEGPVRPRPDAEANLWRYIQHIAEKVRIRVRQGFRSC